MPTWQRYTDPPSIERHVQPLPPHLAELDGVTLVQVSDLHVGRYMRGELWEAHVARINALRPDLVVITGDAMDWARRYEERAPAEPAGTIDLDHRGETHEAECAPSERRPERVEETAAYRQELPRGRQALPSRALIGRGSERAVASGTWPA